MGKGKAKPTKSAEKTAIKNAKREAKRAAREASGAPIPNHLLLKAQNKSAAKSKSKPPSTSLPTSGPKPFVKTHAKWPSLFKRHLGLIESHIKALDRVMQSMKSEMEQMEEKEREEYELEEGGHWRRICGMVDRSREVLVQARECGVGILPSEFLRDKKGLGVTGTSFEPLEPKFAERAEKLGYNKKPVQNGAAAVVDGEGDSEMEDVPSLSSDADSDSSVASSSSDSDSSSDDEKEDDKKTTAEEEKAEKKPVPVVEPNPYFVIDTQPMPVRGLNKHPLPSIKRSKKLPEDGEDGDVKKSRKSKKEKVTEEPVDAEPETEPANEQPTQGDDSKKSKKRTHDDSPELKKPKKSKKEKAVIPAPDPEPATTQSRPQPQPDPEPPKKSKKRANSTTSDTSTKKSKKHKSAEPEAPASIVDFNEVQRKLQAEVDAGEKEKVGGEKKKKRRRSSGDGVGVGGESVKKAKKGKDS